MIGWSPRQIKKTRSSPSTATPATSRCSNPFGSCSQPSTTSYLMVGLLRDSTPGALHAPARSYTVAALREASMCLDPISRRRLLRAMRMLTTWLAVVALLLGVGALAPVAAQPAGTLVVGLVAEPVNLDPAQVTDLNSNRVGRRIVETLVSFPDESTQIVPGLAESWTVSKDGVKYAFKLRKSVSFHDGTLQVRVVGPRPARGAGEERRVLEAPGEDRSRDLPADRRGPGAAHRADDGGARPHRRHAARLRRAAREQPQDHAAQAGGRARLVPRHQQPEEAVRRQARAPGPQLRREQGGHRA